MPSAARLGDLIGHAPPIPPDARGRGGPGGVPTGLIIGPCSGNVFVNGIPAARSGVDLAVCSLHPPVPLPIATGSSNVFINGCPAVRLGDLIKCSAIVITGSGNVFIGGGGSGASGTVQTGVLIPELETEPVILQSLEASDAGAEGLGLDESVPPMSYGEQMSKVGGFYGDLAIGAAKGILNLIPETLAFAYRMSGYAIAGVASHFDSDISYAMFSKYEKVTGRIWQYENSVQAFGGVAAQVASPVIFRGATAVGAVIYNAEIGAVWVASAGETSNLSRQIGVMGRANATEANSGGDLFRVGRSAASVEKTFDHALDKDLYLNAVAKQYGINLRGSGKDITVKYDNTLGPLVKGVTKEIEGGHIIRIGSSVMDDEAAIANTLAHELSHARDFLRGANRNGGHKAHGTDTSSPGDGSVYGSGNAIEDWIKGNR